MPLCWCVAVLVYSCIVVLVPDQREWELERVHALPQQLFCCCCCHGCCLLLFLLHSRLLQRRSLSPSIVSLYLSRSPSSIIQRLAATLAFAAPPHPPSIYTYTYAYIYVVLYVIGICPNVGFRRTLQTFGYINLVLTGCLFDLNPCFAPL